MLSLRAAVSVGDGGECSREKHPTDTNVKGKTNVAETGHRPWLSAWIFAISMREFISSKISQLIFIVDRCEPECSAI